MCVVDNAGEPAVDMLHNTVDLGEVGRFVDADVSVVTYSTVAHHVASLL